MFGIFKRKSKEQAGAGDDEVWGKPTQRKMSKEEAARDAAEQQMIEEKNRERREMYRLPGRERIFTDLEGRRLALRTEDNTGPQASPHHPPLLVVVFWGTREIGHVQAEFLDGSIRQLDAKIERGYENRGIGQVLLAELETIAREKGLRRVQCSGVDHNEWNAEFLAQAGYTSQGGEMVKMV